MKIKLAKNRVILSMTKNQFRTLLAALDNCADAHAHSEDYTGSKTYSDVPIFLDSLITAMAREKYGETEGEVRE